MVNRTRNNYRLRTRAVLTYLPIKASSAFYIKTLRQRTSATISNKTQRFFSKEVLSALESLWHKGTARGLHLFNVIKAERRLPHFEKEHVTAKKETNKLNNRKAMTNKKGKSKEQLGKCCQADLLLPVARPHPANPKLAHNATCSSITQLS